MIALMSPQFATQDDNGRGDGIPPISQWIELANDGHEIALPPLNTLELEPAVETILGRLHILFHGYNGLQLTTTDFHDLVCFLLHRLLDQAAHAGHSDSTSALSTSDCVRHALALYLLIVHGPTYFSHARLQYTVALQLQERLDDLLDTMLLTNPQLAIWTLSVGMVAAYGTQECQWFTAQTARAVSVLGIHGWEDVLSLLREILWLEDHPTEQTFQQAWQAVWSSPAT
jgi:hypothetical protein